MFFLFIFPFFSLHHDLVGCVTPCMSSSRYRENLSYWLTFGVSAVIQLLKLCPTGQIPVWVLSQWHRGHFSCWPKLNNTMNISFCELHKHKYHGILSHIWCYFISRNNCEAKALKWRLSEVQIFCDLIHAAVFFHVSRKEQMRELISVRWPTPQQAKARAGEGYFCCSLRSTDDKAKR